jgi:hypothetical protein
MSPSSSPAVVSLKPRQLVQTTDHVMNLSPEFQRQAAMDAHHQAEAAIDTTHHHAAVLLLATFGGAVTHTAGGAEATQGAGAHPVGIAAAPSLAEAARHHGDEAEGVEDMDDGPHHVAEEEPAVVDDAVAVSTATAAARFRGAAVETEVTGGADSTNEYISFLLTTLAN